MLRAHHHAASTQPARALQWLVSPDEVVLLMLNSLAALTSKHRLQLLLFTVGAVTSGLALCEQHTQ
jgi:hypothetical protein